MNRSRAGSPRSQEAGAPDLSFAHSPVFYTHDRHVPPLELAPAGRWTDNQAKEEREETTKNRHHRRLIQKRTPGTSVQPVRRGAGTTRVVVEKVIFHAAGHDSARSDYSPVWW